MSRRIIFSLFILSLFVLSLRLFTVAEASGGHENSEHLETSHDNHAKSEVSHNETHGEEHKGEHGEEHGEDHHIWWTFPGYEIPFAIFACIYFALVLAIWPKLFGKHQEEGQH